MCIYDWLSINGRDPLTMAILTILTMNSFINKKKFLKIEIFCRYVLLLIDLITSQILCNFIIV
jgi:hypothetical protein